MALLGLSHCLLHVGGKVRCNCEKYKKTKQEVHLVQEITVRTSTKHNVAQQVSLQIDNDKHPTKTRTPPHRHNRCTTVFNFIDDNGNFPEGSQNIKYTQSSQVLNSKLRINNCRLNSKFPNKPL